MGLKRLDDLKKGLSKRVVLWIGYGIGLLLYILAVDDFYWSMAIGNLLLAGLGLVDEKIKEGYWFKRSDLAGRHWTHEKLIVWAFINGLAMLVLGVLT